MARLKHAQRGVIDLGGHAQRSYDVLVRNVSLAGDEHAAVGVVVAQCGINVVISHDSLQVDAAHATTGRSPY